MLIKRYSRCWLPASLLLLGSCTVYAPTVPSTPLIEKGQVEVTAATREFIALDLGAAWSPVPHLLLTGEVAWQSRGKGESNANGTQNEYEDYHRQVGAGIGYYRAAVGQKRRYLAAVGGVGFASVNLHDIDVTTALFIIPLPYVSGFYEARYRHYYGQLYAAQPLGEYLTSGLSVRGTWVDYTQLTIDGQSVAPANRFFIEPAFFLRAGSGPLQGQFTAGLSLPTARDGANPTVSKTAPVSGLVSLGLVFRPDLLHHRK
ncbi:MAG: hypothetical protein ACRYFX_28690 [Janthinobacterium lividum]